MENKIHRIKHWYYSRPMLARTYLPICFLFTLLVTYGLISPFHIFYTFEQTFIELNIWRPFTALFFLGKFDVNFLFNIYIAYRVLVKVETFFNIRGEYDSFLWFVGLLSVGCVIFGSIFKLYFLADSLLMGIIYMWGKWMPH